MFVTNVTVFVSHLVISNYLWALLYCPTHRCWGTICLGEGSSRHWKIHKHSHVSVNIWFIYPLSISYNVACIYLAYNVLPAWIIASSCGPAWEHNPTTVYSISPKPRPISWKNATLGRSPLPNHHFPRFPLSSIIWSNTSRSKVYAMVFTTCHISDNFPRNKLSSFYLPHQSAGPQLWISFYLYTILYPSDVIT